MQKIKIREGQASNTGFKITARNGKTVQSKSYTEAENKFTGKHIAAFGVILFFYYFILMLSFSHYDFSRLIQNLRPEPGWWGALILLFAAYPSWLMMDILLAPNDLGKNFLEYHACEHKVVVLLEKGYQLNLENLKKISRISLCCGSFEMGILGTLPLTLSIFLALVTYLPWPWLNFFIALFFTIGLNFTLTLSLQFLFLTSEPSEEKLKEALEVAEEFYK